MTVPRVFVLEDNPATCRQLASAIEADGRLALAATAATLALARHWWDSGARADAALVDLGLPDGNGIDFIRIVAASEPAPAILVIRRQQRIRTWAVAFPWAESFRQQRGMIVAASLTWPTVAVRFEAVRLRCERASALQSPRTAPPPGLAAPRSRYRRTRQPRKRDRTAR